MLALKHLALFLRDGAGAVAQDVVRAAQLLSQVIEDSGDCDAMVSLAKLIEQGDEGVERDAARSVCLYLLAIEAGHMEAQEHLDKFFSEEGGRGVAENVARVTQLYGISQIEEPSWVCGCSHETVQPHCSK